MIRANLPFLPLLYAVVLMGGILLLWLAGEWTRGRRRKREWKEIDQCRLCAAWVRPPSTNDLWRCPSCRALNERSVPADL